LFIAATLKRINPEFFWNYFIDASLAWRAAARAGAAFQALLLNIVASKTSKDQSRIW